MRTIEQIIADAQAALTGKCADEAEAAEAKAQAERQENAKLWTPIVEGLKDAIPVELHGAISFDAGNPPNANDHWEPSQRTRRPILITLPTPEKYTVFGYFFDDNCQGFAPGVLSHDEDGQPYFTTSRDYALNEYEVGALPAFEIALAETVGNYRPSVSKPKLPKAWNPEPMLAERLESIIREIVRDEARADDAY
jgi:hypothetical protein